MIPNWKTVKEYSDITYKKSNNVARIAFNRPEVRNAFRPKTTSELLDALHDAQEDTSIGVVLLSGEGPSSKDGVWSFCSGGDQKARGEKGRFNTRWHYQRSRADCIIPCFKIILRKGYANTKNYRDNCK